MSPSQGILTPSVPHGYGHPHPRGSDPQHPPGTVMSLSQVTPHRHAGLGVSRQVPVLVRGEGTGHSGESQSKGTRRKRGARPGRKETLPGHFPGTAANTKGCLAAAAVLGVGGLWAALGHPVTPWAPNGKGEIGIWWKSQAASVDGSRADALWKEGGGGGRRHMARLHRPGAPGTRR